MKKWHVTVKIEDEPPEELEMYDFKDIYDSYISINRTFFNEILAIVKMVRKYAIGKGIEKVIGPDRKLWTQNPWLLIMFKDNEIQVPYWLLLKREKDLNGTLVAVGPENFYKFCLKDKDSDDEIKRMIEYLIAYPQKFKVSIIIPNVIP
jgi:hypothetical protein